MSRKSLKIVLGCSLIAAQLLAGACSANPSEQNSPSNTVEALEAKMDPILERDVQMLLDAYPSGDYNRQNVVYAVKSLRDKGLGPFVSIEKIPDEDIPNFDRIVYVTFMLKITDETNSCYRVGFSQNGLPVTL